MFGIGSGELLLIAFIALLVLGPERMPQLMRDVGKAMTDLRKTSDELQREFLNSDRKISAEKVLDVVTRPSTTSAPEPAPAAEPVATTADAPSEPVTQAEVATPTEPEETAFDREARLARERIDRLG